MLSVVFILALAAAPIECVAVYEIHADTALGDGVGPVVTASVVADMREVAAALGRSGGSSAELETRLKTAQSLQLAPICAWTATAVLGLATTATAGFVDWRGHRNGIQLASAE